jgi:universal stress protein E
MSAIRKILVPIKTLTSRTQPAVLKAAQLARAHGASLELFHVLTPSMYPAPLVRSQTTFSVLEKELRQGALRRLEVIADRLRVHTIKVAVSAEWDYPEYEAIIRRARAIKADLIVASRHAGRRRLPWLLKLTDWELVRMSPVPVLLVKNPHPYRRPGMLAAIDPSRAHEKPQTLDRDILRLASKWSKVLNGSLHAVHAYTRFPINTPPEVLKPGMLEELEELAARTARRQFTRALRSMRIPRKRQHLIPLSPVEAIGEAVTRSRSAIVVMGVISRTGFKRLLIGDTAEQLLDTLSCDILVVKPSAFRSRVPGATRAAHLKSATPMPFGII